MLILIHNNLLCNNAEWRALDALLDRARDRRCYVDTLDPDSVAANEWLRQLDQSRVQDWITATDWAARDAAVFRLRPIVAAAETDISRPSRVQLSLADVLSLVDRPMQFWVENSRNDRRFWLAMMSADQRKMFLDLEQRRLVEFTSRGGLDELRASLDEQVARGASSPSDSWVLFDSDGEVPGQRSASAAAMVRFCQAAGLPHYCLTRRAIENYLPRKALWNWANAATGKRKRDRRKLIEAYQRMNADQQQHFHFKSGWPDPKPPQVAALYANVPTADEAILQRGIANDIASLYDTYHQSLHEWVENEGMDAGVRKTLEALTDWIRAPYA